VAKKSVIYQTKKTGMERYKCENTVGQLHKFIDICVEKCSQIVHTVTGLLLLQFWKVSLYSSTCWWQELSGLSLQSKTGRLIWRTRPSVTSAIIPFFLKILYNCVQEIKKLFEEEIQLPRKSTQWRSYSFMYDWCVSKYGCLHALALWYIYWSFRNNLLRQICVQVLR